MRLGVFVQTPGHHVGGWRHPDAVVDGWPNLALMKHIAATAERGKFDMFFLGDGFATGYGEHPSTIGKFEPLTLLSALAMATEQARPRRHRPRPPTTSPITSPARSPRSTIYQRRPRRLERRDHRQRRSRRAMFGRDASAARRALRAGRRVRRGRPRPVGQLGRRRLHRATRRRASSSTPGSCTCRRSHGRVLHGRRPAQRAALAAGPSGDGPGRLLRARPGAGGAHRRRRVHRAARPRRGTGLLSRREGARRRGSAAPPTRSLVMPGVLPSSAAPRPRRRRSFAELQPHTSTRRRPSPCCRSGWASTCRSIRSTGRCPTLPRNRAPQEPRRAADRDGAAREPHPAPALPPRRGGARPSAAGRHAGADRRRDGGLVPRAAPPTASTSCRRSCPARSTTSSTRWCRSCRSAACSAPTTRARRCASTSG